MSKTTNLSERDKIIAAATAMLARQNAKGKKKTTMAELAKELGFSRTLLYYYFPDKASIFKAAVVKVADEAYAAMLRLSETKKLAPYDELRTALRQRADLSRNFYAFGLYNILVVYQNDTEMRAIREREIAYYDSILVRGMQRGDFRKLETRLSAELIVDAFDGLTDVHLSRNDARETGFEHVHANLLAYTDLLLAAVKACP